ncbi:MAG: SbcC/MukB-like Walker B domain-containing protein, partial [Microthrixaceae bacterium]
EQLAALEPLVEAAVAYDDATERRTGYEHQSDAVRFYIAELRSRLLAAEIAQHQGERRDATQELLRLDEQEIHLGSERDGLITERAGAGGDRIGELERLEQVARADIETRRSKLGRYSDLLVTADLNPVGDANGFARAANSANERGSSLAGELQNLDELHADHMVRRNQVSSEITETTQDLESLRGRRSNLPRNLLEVRDALCRDLRVDADDLPFAGELIDVADDHSEWRPAAERVLRGFAQSLLVDQDLYPAVAEWVNGRHLGLRLVYERVPHHRVALLAARDSDALILSDTLEIAAGPFEEYLRTQVTRRAGHLCTRSITDFREADRAVTIEGQLRSGDRHEKDDRRRADDPRYWLLGWSNQSKIDALEAHLATLETDHKSVTGDLDRVDAERKKLWVRQQALSALAEYTDWRELDVAEAQQRQTEARAERDRLLGGSSKLAEIERRLSEVDNALEQLDGRQRHVQARLTRSEERIEQAGKAQQEDLQAIAALSPALLELARANYGDLEAQLGDDVPTRSAQCRPASEQLIDKLRKLIEAAAKDQESHRGSVLRHMSIVRNRWPEATTEMDVSIDARGEFLDFHHRLATDDLPTYEEEFKRLLNTETIRELAGFNNWLRRQREGIQERVGRINEALSAIDYSPSRIIKLVAEPTPNQEIKQFQTDLRAATDDALAPDGDKYSEQRFEEVKRIIERFRGRTDHAEADKAWTAKVTDIRNWFAFAASEQDKISGEEYEHYRDSDGKSGGQKEKLAYTILAASLAYQFGLQWGVEKSRDFRFVVIDEAFGRGSDDSTRYALELFAKLGLQLLVVTPLQKVHVIEPYVKAIGFVDNPARNYSRVQTLTLEEFRERRAQVSG